MASLSAYRLQETASVLCSFSPQFVVLRSHASLPICQYYIVPESWSNSSRTQPLAHINVTPSGDIFVKSFQPQVYDVKITSDELKSKVKRLIN